MSIGMYAAVESSIGPRKYRPEEEVEVSKTLELSTAAETSQVSDERSQEMISILHEDDLQKNPLNPLLQCLVCNSKGDNAKVTTPWTSFVKLAVSWMPILSWFPKLTRSTISADLVAGVTVGVMVIPQSVSYAGIAGLPFVYGMYTAMVPMLTYALFGQSRQLSVGPAALIALLVGEGLRGKLDETECPAWYASDQSKPQSSMCPEEYIKLTVLTSALVGVMQITASFLKLGFLVSFLGHPVISGFTSGAAIIISLSQLKYMLGFDIPKSQYVYETIGNAISDIDQTKIITLLLGAACFFYLILNKKLSQKFKRMKPLGPAGPLICCCVGTLLVWLIPALQDEVAFVKDLPSGLMPFSVSDWELEDLSKVLPTAVSVCLLGYMESIAIANNLAEKHGYKIDAGQELFALGITNLAAGMSSSFPAAASFSRSAVNNSTGARSQLAGLLTSMVMLCTLMFLTPLFYYLPKFTLAAIVMSSVIPLIAISEARKLYAIKKSDFVLWTVAFLGTLFLGVLMGIAIAVLVSLCIVIHESARPQLTILWRIPGTTMYRSVKQESSGAFVPNVFICRIGSSMYFANASFIKDTLLKYVSDLSEVNPTEYMILEMTPVASLDSTAVHVIHDIVADFRARGMHIAFAMVGNCAERTMQKAKLTEYIGARWFFPNVNIAVHFCLLHQSAKKRRGDADTGTITLTSRDLRRQVNAGHEVGISNDMHHDCTMVCVRLAEDLPLMLSDISAAFGNCGITIVRAQIEAFQQGGSKYVFFVKTIAGKGKLSRAAIPHLRKELEGCISCRGFSGAFSQPSRVMSSSSASEKLAEEASEVMELDNSPNATGNLYPGRMVL